MADCLLQEYSLSVSRHIKQVIFLSNIIAQSPHLLASPLNNQLVLGRGQAGFAIANHALAKEGFLSGKLSSLLLCRWRDLFWLETASLLSAFNGTPYHGATFIRENILS